MNHLDDDIEGTTRNEIPPVPSPGTLKREEDRSAGPAIEKAGQENQKAGGPVGTAAAGQEVKVPKKGNTKEEPKENQKKNPKRESEEESERESEQTKTEPSKRKGKSPRASCDSVSAKMWPVFGRSSWGGLLLVL